MSAPIIAPIEQGPKLTKATPVTLKDAGVTEGWLEKEIEKDATILRLGDVVVIERQRRQEKAGRLDLLLEDDLGDDADLKGSYSHQNTDRKRNPR